MEDQENIITPPPLDLSVLSNYHDMIRSIMTSIIDAAEGEAEPAHSLNRGDFLRTVEWMSEQLEADSVKDSDLDLNAIAEVVAWGKTYFAD